MLRPATPLTALLLTSFILLLLSVLSTPLIKGIPIARYEGVNFGVFGFCSPKRCSSFSIGYTTDGLFGKDDKDADFSLPSSARHSLSALLVVHPIAAFFNFVCVGLAAAAHFHSPSHSARYLLALLILLLPTLLVTLLAFLVDILLFVPHLHWGGWVVLASTILITASGVVTCAMRRTLVSRKARKRRIAENAEMSGENFYGRQNAEARNMALNSPTITAPSLPMVNGGPGSDNLPSFSTYKETESGLSYDDRARRAPSHAMKGGPTGFSGGDADSLGLSRTRSQDQHWGDRDEYGNPLPASGVLGPMPPSLHRGPSDPNQGPNASSERVNELASPPQDGFAYGTSRGRGGQQWRGNFGPRRGSLGGPRGGPHPFYGRGGTRGRGRGGPWGATGGGGMNGHNQLGSPPGYPPHHQNISSERFGSLPNLVPTVSNGTVGEREGGRQPSPGGPLSMSPPGPSSQPFQNGAIPPQGIAMMHANSSHDLVSPSSQYSPANAQTPPKIVERQTLVSPSSIYSNMPDASYVPPRAAWVSNGNGRRSASSSPGRRSRAMSPHYYEDVDPRFSDVNVNVEPMPPSLKPGRPPNYQNPGGLLPRTPNDDHSADMEGGRSPNGSEVSHYTSVSQRGVNPQWHPGREDTMNMPTRGHPRKPVGGGRSNADVLLQTNPDFNLPGMQPPGRGGYSGARGFGANGQSGSGKVPSASQVGGMAGGGRYPSP